MQRRLRSRCACASVAILVLATLLSAPAAAQKGASSFTNSFCFFIVDVPAGGGYGGSGTVVETPNGEIYASCHAEFLFGNYVRKPARAEGVVVLFASYSFELLGPCSVQVTPSGHASAVCKATVPGS